MIKSSFSLRCGFVGRLSAKYHFYANQWPRCCLASGMWRQQFFHPPYSQRQMSPCFSLGTAPISPDFRVRRKGDTQAPQKHRFGTDRSTGGHSGSGVLHLRQPHETLVPIPSAIEMGKRLRFRLSAKVNHRPCWPEAEGDHAGAETE